MTDFRIWQIAGWTMLHYLWVGGVLGAIALMMRRLLRWRAANLRYLAALGCFAVLGIAPLPIAVIVTSSLPPPPPRSEPRVEAEPGSDNMPMPLALPEAEEPVEAAVTAPAVPSSPAPAPAPQPRELLQSSLDRAAMDLPWLWVCGAPITLLLTTLGLVGAERLRRQSRLLDDSPIVGNMPPPGRGTEDIAARNGRDLRPHRRADLGGHFSTADPAARRRPDRLGFRSNWKWFFGTNLPTCGATTTS